MFVCVGVFVYVSGCVCVSGREGRVLLPMYHVFTVCVSTCVCVCVYVSGCVCVSEREGRVLLPMYRVFTVCVSTCGV